MSPERIQLSRSDDPDETEGRALYRAHADTLARAQIGMARRRVGWTEVDRASIQRDPLAGRELGGPL